MLLPTGDVVIQDEFTTGVENYKEFFYTLVGLAGEGQNFDGNGMYVRFQTGGGSQTVSLGQARPPAPASCSATRRHAARQPAGLSRPSGRRTVPTRRATSSRAPTSTARPPQTPPTGRAAAAAARDALPLLRKRLRPFGSQKGAR